MAFPGPELELYQPSPATIHGQADTVLARAGDAQTLIDAVHAAHRPAQEGVAGMLADPMVRAADLPRQRSLAVMQANAVFGLALKFFATHVTAYNATVNGLRRQWSDATTNDFGMDVPDDATQAEIDAILQPEATSLASSLAASRQAAEDELDASANDVVALLEGEITDRVLAGLFTAGVLPPAAATAFPGSRFMSQVDLDKRWDNLRASGVIPSDVYDRVAQAPSDDAGASVVLSWLRSGTRRTALIAELELLLGVDALGPTERRLLQGLARYDADKVASPYAHAGSAHYFIADLTEGTSRARQINDRLATGDPQLRPFEREYLRWWLGAVGADHLAALPGRVDRALNAVPQTQTRSQFLDPVANAIMHLSNPAVGGTDGLEHMPEPIQDLASTEIGVMSPKYGRTFRAELVDGQLRLSVPGVDPVAGFADLMTASTVPGGDRFTQQLNEHGTRIGRESFEVHGHSTPAGEPYTVSDVIDEQLGASWSGGRAVDTTAVSLDVDILAGRGQQAGDALESLHVRTDDTAPAPPDHTGPSAPETEGSGGAEPPRPSAGGGPAGRPGAPPPPPAEPAVIRGAAPHPAGPGAHQQDMPFSSDDQARVLDVPAELLPSDAQQWLPHIDRIARENDIDPRLLVALINRVSDFRTDALSPEGAVGLAQLMPETAGDLGVDPNDPIANLEGGARYLRQQLVTFRSVELALAAYNAGPRSVETFGGIPPFDGTQNFVRDVVALYTALRGDLF